MNQNASPKFEILSLFEKGQSERLLKLDKLLLAALTLIYAVIALLNLGTLSFPTSVYEGAVGDSFTLDNHRFTVTEMDGFRVTRIQVTEEEPQPPEPEEEKKPEEE